MAEQDKLSQDKDDNFLFVKDEERKSEASSFRTDPGMNDYDSSVAPPLKTHRKKALICVSLGMILIQTNQAMLKLSVNEKGIATSDILFLRPLISLILALASIKIFRVKRSEMDTGQGRKKILIYARFLIAPVAVMMMTYGTLMIPLTIRQSLVNARPFFISAFAYCFLGETLSGFELFIMVSSFLTIVFTVASTPDPVAEDSTNEVEY